MRMYCILWRCVLEVNYMKLDKIGSLQKHE